MATILIVEDDETLVETLRYNFERAGYELHTATDGVRGLELARSVQPDLIILDIMMPKLDGFSVCRILRQETSVPILMLTALHEEMHRIAGLELGANDYVLKPFSLGELLARVRSLLRWTERPVAAKPEVLQADTLRLDPSSRRAWRGERELTLTHKEFDLLTCLMRHRGVALSRDLLLERVWGYDFPNTHRTIDVHIRWLREKIEQDPSNPVLIQTVRGVGYRFYDAAGQ
jgi:DNA-binding response OmpR family regulator